MTPTPIHDAAFGRFTDTLYTIAQIADVGNQLLSQAMAASVPVLWTTRRMSRTRRLLPKTQRWRLAK